MNKILIILIILFNTISYSQTFKGRNWKDFNYDDAKHFTVTKTEKFTINKLLFNVVWGNNIFYDKNIGYYGGIKSLKIYNGKKLLNSFENIEDFIGLGEIYFEFNDYNFDGYLDFSYPIYQGAHTWRTYYLYNNKAYKFINYKNWDYITISKINKVTKQILSQFDGNCCEGDKSLYQVTGHQIKLLKIFHYKYSPD
jgi:hypothetical protein